MYAIVWCEELQISWPNTKEKAVETAAGFSSISTNHVMAECVAVLNGYHMAITTPPKKEVHNIKSYFSGHYQTYSINIQAACDHNCHFLFIGVGGPGVMGDREAVKESGLSKLVEKLPGLLYCIGDCVYTPTEHLIPIYGIYCPNNMALSPEEVVLHERVANYKGRELTVNCEAPYSNNREQVVAIIESYGYTREGAMGNNNRKRTRE